MRGATFIFGGQRPADLKTELWCSPGWGGLLVERGRLCVCASVLLCLCSCLQANTRESAPDKLVITKRKTLNLLASSLCRTLISVRVVVAREGGRCRHVQQPPSREGGRCRHVPLPYPTNIGTISLIPHAHLTDTISLPQPTRNDIQSVTFLPGVWNSDFLLPYSSCKSLTFFFKI